MPSLIITTQATGEDVEAIINERLVPAVNGLERHKVLMALLSFVLVLMKPTITSEELVEGVRGVSQWLCLFLSTPDMGDDIKGMN